MNKANCQICGSGFLSQHRPYAPTYGESHSHYAAGGSMRVPYWCSDCQRKIAAGSLEPLGQRANGQLVECWRTEADATVALSEVLRIFYPQLRGSGNSHKMLVYANGDRIRGWRETMAVLVKNQGEGIQ